jgi:hypothetical protein
MYLNFKKKKGYNRRVKITALMRVYKNVILILDYYLK